MPGAVYTGDAENASATSSCEQLTVQGPEASVVTTSLPVSLRIGESVNDQATLTDVTADAGGTVTYYYGSPADCTAGTGTKAGTRTVTSGQVAASTPVTFQTADTYDWVVNSGDADNLPATSSCEQLVVAAKESSAISTVLEETLSLSAGKLPTVGVDDRAFLSNVTADAGGTVTYYYGSAASAKLLRLENYVKDMQAVSHDYILMGLDLLTDEEYTSAGG